MAASWLSSRTQAGFDAGWFGAPWAAAEAASATTPSVVWPRPRSNLMIMDPVTRPLEWAGSSPAMVTKVWIPFPPLWGRAGWGVGRENLVRRCTCEPICDGA